MPFDGKSFEHEDEVLQRLLLGRERVARRWCQRGIADKHGGVCALGGVINSDRPWEDIVRGTQAKFWDVAGLKAQEYLTGAVPGHRRYVPAYNNAPTTTQTDILALFDRAIAARREHLAQTADASSAVRAA